MVPGDVRIAETADQILGCTLRRQSPHACLMGDCTQVRRLTVSRIYQTRSSGPGVRAPMIRLTGKWLEEAGFAAGETVTVQVEQGRIVVTQVSPNRPAEPVQQELL